jgi:hypothetical protein
MKLVIMNIESLFSTWHTHNAKMAISLMTSEIVFYDADETELGLPPEDSLPVPNTYRPQILTKCTPDDDNLCSRMSGGEIPINNGIL